jgi:hypothetical protein
MATLGLACNLLLWTVPASVGAAGLAHVFLRDTAPALADSLQTPARRTDGVTPNLLTALRQLIGAESEALQVAGLGLQQPTPADLGPRADAAGVHVLQAVSTYISAAQSLVHAR